VGFTDLVTPISSPNGNHRQLRQNNGSSDSSSYFLGALDTQTDVSIGVTDSNKCLETGSLPGTSLLLHGHDLQNLVLQGGPDEVIDDLELLDGQREQVDFLQGLDLSAGY